MGAREFVWIEGTIGVDGRDDGVMEVLALVDVYKMSRRGYDGWWSMLLARWGETSLVGDSLSLPW